MKRFIDLSTRGKLFVSFGLMIVLLAIVLVTAYRYLTKIQSSQTNDLRGGIRQRR